MNNEIVLQSLDRGLLTITMNRPDRRNALNADMTRGLVEAARRAVEDHEVRAVLLKGAGGTFCVGGDVKSMAEGRAPLPFEAKMANLRRGMEVSRILHDMPKPVVAQVDGAAAGAGLSIALACDLRVASASVKITTAFAKVGLSGDYGGTYFLTHLLGSAKARELYLMSPVLSAQEAFALGIVTKVVPDAEVEAAAHELAMSLAQGPSVTLGYIKRNINNAEHLSLEVVAPLQPGTAAGRFIDKTGGRGGYMAIFCCDDPDERGEHAKAMGVRVANVIDHAPYHGVQLHPRDCRAAFIEFNHTDGSDDILGPYPPAGPDWQKSIAKDVTQALIGVEMESPEPRALAEHWGRIIGIPVTQNQGEEPELKLPNASFRFVKGMSDIMSGLTFRVGDIAAVRDAAKTRGHPLSGDSFLLGGVTFRLVA